MDPPKSYESFTESSVTFLKGIFIKLFSYLVGVPPKDELSSLNFLLVLMIGLDDVSLLSIFLVFKPEIIFLYNCEFVVLAANKIIRI